MSDDRRGSIELGYPPAPSARERFVQRANAWQAPRLPDVEGTAVRRWASNPTWVPPDSQLLVRHRSLDGHRRVITNDRRPPSGFTIEYDLGLVHQFAQPGTQRLIVKDEISYFCTPFEGGLAEGFRGLGYVEEAPLPMLDALELRRDPTTGEEVLVAGVEDPLYDVAIPMGNLGFIESYPINPRCAPDQAIHWGLTMLQRSVDPARWLHRYRVDEQRTSGSTVLGSLWTRAGSGFTAVHRHTDGSLVSDLIPKRSSIDSALTAKLRWAAAPLSWTQARPRSWAARATANRLRRLLGENALRATISPRSAGDTLLGYLRRGPALGWSPLFSASHPALADQYVTRSEIEATDMGYTIDGVLGYILDRGADRSREALPAEVKWASRFGQRRRYIEGYSA